MAEPLTEAEIAPWRDSIARPSWVSESTVTMEAETFERIVATLDYRGAETAILRDTIRRREDRNMLTINVSEPEPRVVYVPVPDRRMRA